MVYYFTSTTSDPAATIYVGKDKTENEELIKYGWDEDVWVSPRLPLHIRPLATQFHADNLSSAHIYLRLEEDQAWDSLPTGLVEDCAQLTKANSIEGNKKDNVTIIYTPWSNLKKSGAMAVGQVGFHNPQLTKKILVPTRTNATINRLNKTRTEIPPPASSSHLREAREAHMAARRKVVNEERQKVKQEEARLARERRENKLRSEAEWNALYGDGRVEEEGKGNWEGYDEDDFM